MLCDGSPLPPRLHAHLRREWVRLGVLQRQIRGLEQERRGLLPHIGRRECGAGPQGARSARDRHQQRLAQNIVAEFPLLRLFMMEFFGWREFRNRRQVGALAGLVASPYSSGESERELGISKAGNRTFVHWRLKLPGAGCASSPRVNPRNGIGVASPTAARTSQACLRLTGVVAYPMEH
jgi:hypothetical protein